MKAEHEFFAVDGLPWQVDATAPTVLERVLSRGDDERTLTRVARWEPGTDTSAAGVIRHAYFEEVYILDGELLDLTLGTTFTSGHYASRPPGMPHGPYRTDTGATMLEIRWRTP
ncbi:ChrR-like protein with cupin domain [Actinophytocola oryzae]|uniref:ChrR-like protein with cupin domain n=2 Tax=Actinophytocola oryzae TaxID=502181 RepID=A0A4R7W3U6_9PSEU|nr:ChrR-like protein with cupin domain [Actinophytocola oryzae]